MDEVTRFKNNFGFFTPIYYGENEGNGFDDEMEEVAKPSCLERFLQVVDGYFDYGKRACAQVNGKEISICQIRLNQSRAALCLKKASRFTIVIPIIMLLVKLCTYPIRRAKIADLTCMIGDKDIGKVKDVFSKSFKLPESDENVVKDKSIDPRLFTAAHLGLHQAHYEINGNQFTTDQVIETVGEEINKALKKEAVEDGFTLNTLENNYLKELQNVVYVKDIIGTEIPSSIELLIDKILSKMVEKNMISSFAVVENGIYSFKK